LLADLNKEQSNEYQSYVHGFFWHGSGCSDHKSQRFLTKSRMQIC
jgi:hypothetical protein